MDDAHCKECNALFDKALLADNLFSNLPYQTIHSNSERIRGSWKSSQSTGQFCCALKFARPIWRSSRLRSAPMPQSWWGMYPAAKYWPIYADPTQAWPWMVLRGPPANGIPDSNWPWAEYPGPPAAPYPPVAATWTNAIRHVPGDENAYAGEFKVLASIRSN
jgi:hypothetical protein